MAFRYATLVLALLAFGWLASLIFITQYAGYRVDFDIGMDSIPVLRCTSNYIHVDFDEPFHSRQIVTLKHGHEDLFTAVCFRSFSGNRVSLKLNWGLSILSALTIACGWPFLKHIKSLTPVETPAHDN